MAKSVQKDDEKLNSKNSAKSNKNDKSEKKKKADSKPNIFVRMGRRLKETFSELKRVTWPSVPKALKATGVVLVIVLIFTVITTGVNTGFSELLKLISNLGD